MSLLRPRQFRCAGAAVLEVRLLEGADPAPSSGKFALAAGGAAAVDPGTARVDGDLFQITPGGPFSAGNLPDQQHSRVRCSRRAEWMEIPARPTLGVRHHSSDLGGWI